VTEKSGMSFCPDGKRDFNERRYAENVIDPAEPRIREIVRMARGFRRVLDAGCCGGEIGGGLAAAGSAVFGIDFSRKALARATGVGIKVAQADIEAGLPFAPESFDCVVAAEIIEHLDDTDSFLKELKRILAPGGLLVISTPNLAWWLNRLRLACGRVPWSYPGASRTVRKSIAVDLNHLRINVRSEWLALFRAHSLEPTAQAGYRLDLPRPPGLWPRLRDGLDALLSHFSDMAFGLVFALRRASI